MTDDDDRTDIEKAFDRLTGRLGEAFNKIKQGQLPAAPPAPAADAAPGSNAAQAFNVDAFFRAVKLNKTAEIQKYIDGGFDLNTYNSAGLTALHVVARENARAAGELLLQNGANPRLPLKDDARNMPLDDAVNFGKHEIVELLTRYGGYVPGNTVNGRTLLHRACEKGKPRIVEALIKAGANANELTENGSTPLLIAIYARQAEVANVLLSFPEVVQGVNEFFPQTDPKKRNAFQVAVEHRQSGTVAMMLTTGSNVNACDAEGLSPLHHAVLAGDAALVKTLLQHGADLNKTENSQPTPLFLACESPLLNDDQTRAHIVTLLLQAGADPDITDAKSGMTPLHASLRTDGAQAAARALLQYPISKDATDKDGNTPLFYALQAPGTDLLAMMLAAGADPNTRHMKDARTPLMDAVQRDNPVAVRLLLQAGANAKLLDADHKSALSYARAKNNDIILLSLEEALGRVTHKAAKPKNNFKEFDL
ncbi:MAG: ankyrin repeat domain-containing protein [Micavibrio sp.]|nr:ankyrin repeat domain-containing protein [Micavibrio sp.]